MELQEQLLLEPLLDQNKVRRRGLLPMWMKVFIWIFMIMGVIAPFCLPAGLSGARVQLALYGLQTTEPLSTAGLIIVLLFFYKGVVAYGLWVEKDWAIDFGVIDAVLGIMICLCVTILPFVNGQSGFVFTFRLELVALIPYLIKLRKVKAQWQAKCA